MLPNLRLSRLEIIQIILIVIGAVLLFIGASIEVPLMINLGLLLAGTGILSSGVDALILNRVGFWSHVSQDLFGSGIRAILAGILLSLLGIWICIFALIRILGLVQPTAAFFASHPAIVLLNAALLTLLLAAFAFLRLEGWSASIQNVLRALPLIIVGVILLLIAVVLLAIGLYALLEPQAFNSWLHGPGTPFMTPTD